MRFFWLFNGLNFLGYAICLIFERFRALGCSFGFRALGFRV